jgi:hypothetical protein
MAELRPESGTRVNGVRHGIAGYARKKVSFSVLSHVAMHGETLVQED